MAELQRSGLDEEEADIVMREVMDRLSGSKLTPLDEVILDDDHPLVQQAIVEHMVHGGFASADGGGFLPMAGPSKRPRVVRTKTWEWPSEHVAIFARQGMDWLTARTFDENDFLINPGLAALNHRETEMLQLAGVVDFPEVEPRVLEISQAAHRRTAQPKRGHTGTVFPRCRFYFTHRARLHVPAEALQLQGIYIPRDVIEATPDRVVASLAGNAFDTGCCLASFFAGLLMLSSGWARIAQGDPSREVKELVALTTRASHADDGSSDEAEALFEVAWGRRFIGSGSGATSDRDTRRPYRRSISSDSLGWS